MKKSQAECAEKVLNMFNMSDAKLVNVLLGGHFNLSKAQTSIIEDEKALMSEVPYASAVGSLMYAIICIRSDITQAGGVIARYMSNPEKKHWRAVK